MIIRIAPPPRQKKFLGKYPRGSTVYVKCRVVGDAEVESFSGEPSLDLQVCGEPNCHIYARERSVQTVQQLREEFARGSR